MVLAAAQSPLLGDKAQAAQLIPRLCSVILTAPQHCRHVRHFLFEIHAWQGSGSSSMRLWQLKHACAVTRSQQGSICLAIRRRLHRSYANATTPPYSPLALSPRACLLFRPLLGRSLASH